MVLNIFNLFIISLERLFVWWKVESLVTFPLRTVTFPWSEDLFSTFYGIVGIRIDGDDDNLGSGQAAKLINPYEVVRFSNKGAVDVLNQRSGGEALLYVCYLFTLSPTVEASSHTLYWTSPGYRIFNFCYGQLQIPHDITLLTHACIWTTRSFLAFFLYMAHTENVVISWIKALV